MDESQRKIIEKGMTQAFKDGLELGQMMATPPIWKVDMQGAKSFVNHCESLTRDTIESWDRERQELRRLAIEGWYLASNDLLDSKVAIYLKSKGVPQDIINGVMAEIEAFREKCKVNMVE